MSNGTSKSSKLPLFFGVFVRLLFLGFGGSILLQIHLNQHVKVTNKIVHGFDVIIIVIVINARFGKRLLDTL